MFLVRFSLARLHTFRMLWSFFFSSWSPWLSSSCVVTANSTSVYFSSKESLVPIHCLSISPLLSLPSSFSSLLYLSLLSQGGMYLQTIISMMSFYTASIGCLWRIFDRRTIGPIDVQSGPSVKQVVGTKLPFQIFVGIQVNCTQIAYSMIRNDCTV